MSVWHNERGLPLYTHTLLIPELVSLKISQFVLCPILKLVMGDKCDDPSLLVLEPASVNVHSNLILSKVTAHKGNHLRNNS